jgi:hypothetical protein
MASIDTPESGRAVDHLAAIDGAVDYAVCAAEKAGRCLELAIRSERHPVGGKIEFVCQRSAHDRDLMIVGESTERTLAQQETA